jgi:hypothetical protein
MRGKRKEEGVKNKAGSFLFGLSSYLYFFAVSHHQPGKALRVHLIVAL